MTKIEIGKFNVGHGCDPFIIAEAGINHNGNIQTAYEMIHVAKKSGANAIKFQTFKANEVVGNTKEKYTYFSQGKEITESMLEMFKRYEFERNDWIKIKNKCIDEKIMFLSTPQNLTDLELLLELDVPAIKVGSDDFTNLPLLKKYVETKLPLLISCGMTNLSEVSESLETIGSFNEYPTILLVTTSQYPTSTENANISRLNTLSKIFPNIPLGFSDHTIGHLASSLAVSLGACVFEKHFTLDNNFPGPDHWFSENPDSLQKLIDSIKLSHSLLGNPLIKPTKKEEEMKILARRSITIIKDVKMGSRLTNKNIGFRRPGNGLSPKFIDHVLGLKASKNLKAGELLSFGDVKK
jgi:N,N'-diacetyllegionaminate synthase